MNDVAHDQTSKLIDEMIDGGDIDEELAFRFLLASSRDNRDFNRKLYKALPVRLMFLFQEYKILGAITLVAVVLVVELWIQSAAMREPILLKLGLPQAWLK